MFCVSAGTGLPSETKIEPDCRLFLFQCTSSSQLKVPVEKGHNWHFLTDLCFSLFKMDPARPSYYSWVTLGPRPLFRRRTLGQAARKSAKPPFFSNWRLKCPSWVRFSAILVRTPRNWLRPSHRGSPVALPGFFMLMGHREEPVIPLHSLHTAMYAIRVYLLPSNHRKACRETKWTICDRAPLASSKQISISVEASLNSGTSCMVRDGKWATTHNSTLFGQEVHPYFLPGLTLVFDTDHFLTFGAKTTKSTPQFFGEY